MDRYFQRFSASRHFIELRLIRDGEVRRHWLKAQDMNALAMSSLALMNGHGWNIYAGVNPRPHSCSDVAEVVALHVDLDHRAPFIPASVPPATMVIDSGHGFHYYWELESAVVPSDHVADINRGLAEIIGGDPHCCDITRILRVPGMMNNKEPKRATILTLANERRYRLEEFEQFAKPLGNSGSAAKAHRENGRSLDAIITGAIKEDSYLRRAWNHDIGDGASDCRYVVIKLLDKKGFSLDEIESVVGDRRWFNRHTKRVTPREKAVADVRRILGKAHISL